MDKSTKRQLHKPDSVSLAVIVIYLCSIPVCQTRISTLHTILPCTMWGLPAFKITFKCRVLLPHVFTLTLRRFLFCGAFRSFLKLPFLTESQMAHFLLGVRTFLLKIKRLSSLPFVGFAIVYMQCVYTI